VPPPGLRRRSLRPQGEGRQWHRMPRRRRGKRRVLAAYLHARSGYGGAALARSFKVPRSTAYGWLEWFESLPDGLRDGILAFMDTQAPIMAACQVPAAVPKPAAPPEGGSSSIAAPVAQTL